MTQSVKGYRDLPKEVTDLVDYLKGMEEHTKIVCNALSRFANEVGDADAGRWASNACDHFEQGFMFAVKVATRPTGGLGRKSTPGDADEIEPARRALETIRGGGKPKRGQDADSGAAEAPLGLDSPSDGG